MFRQIGPGEIILILSFLVLMTAAITTIVLVGLRMTRPSSRQAVSAEAAKHRR